MTAAPIIDSYLSDAVMRERFLREVAEGLTSEPKLLQPKWFYDDVGCELFDQITRLPEYYPTRVERSILIEHAQEISHLARPNMIVELGSGESDKTPILLDAVRPRRFVALDVSDGALDRSIRQLSLQYPQIRMQGIVADFEQHLTKIPSADRRLIAFLGSTIGNLDPPTRAKFLQHARSMLTSGDTLLLGIDLVKDPRRLHAAYDDASGITARFNKNVLQVLNNELDADFDLDGFEHVARWDSENEWMEMSVRATSEQFVTLEALELDIRIAEGELIRTEISSKFRQEKIVRELERASLRLTHWWTDQHDDFAVLLATVEES